MSAKPTVPDPYDADGPNPFDEVEFLPGLGLAVVCVVLAFLLVNLLLSVRAA